MMERTDRPPADTHPAADLPFGPLVGGLRDALREFVEAARESAEGAASADSERHAVVGKAQQERQSELARLDKRLAADRARAAQEHADAVARLAAERDARLASARRESASAREDANERLENALRNADQRAGDALWLAETVDDSDQHRLKAEHAALRRAMDALRKECDQLASLADAAMTRYGLALAPPLPADSPADLDPATLDRLAQSLRAAAARLPRLWTPTIASPWNLAIGLIVAAAIGASIAALVAGLENWPLVASGAAVASMAVALALLVLQSRGRAAARSLHAQASSAAAEIRRTIAANIHRADERLERRLAETVARLSEEARTAEQSAASRRDAARREHADSTRAALERERRAVDDATRAFDELGARANARRDQALADADELERAERPRITERCDRLIAEAERHADAVASALRARRDAAHRRLAALAADAARDDARWCPPWPTVASDRWSPAEAAGGVARIGRIDVDLALLGDNAATAALAIPAWLELSGRASLAITADQASRDRALALLRTAAARLLCAAPPGRVRLTIIDPIGLGASFAGFMRLLDHDPALVDHSVATDTRDIEQRLKRLTDHVETVIQRCLRNEFADIHRYNAQAGDLAEPFHLVVFADLPHALSEPAARSLARIARAGARCGVFVLSHHDAARPLPPGLTADDLAAAAVHIDLRAPAPRWIDPAFGPWSLAIDEPPPDHALDGALRRLGEAWRSLRRVRVPFQKIAPPDDALWTARSDAAIDVPIGLAGPGRTQSFSLGVGTAQHALVAGRTGSGKSTLLHTLIASVATRHGPDDVEFHLIDFKKGVEFKPYASENLPHARVVAIESDREFGLSVLQRLDEELRDRGKRFREAGAQDIAGYRAARPAERMPRVMLLVDEFQEFFVDDDGVAQNAALLLDRLVRQGRAFGMHVVLGSQTLGGAYNLARSTLGQMAVRIALQCAEQDASLILSEENRAAVDLSRPGEAIYNDESGAADANSHFQVAWIGDDERLAVLARLRAEARSRAWTAPARTIVFEGHALADIADNEPLAHALRAPPQHAAPLAWLGDPVAIKAPTCAAFGRTGASNLLLVGPRDDSAGALLVAALAGALATSPGHGPARLWWLGPSPGPGAPDLPAIARRLGADRLEAVPPGASLRALEEALALIDARRAGEPDAAPAFLMLAGVHFLRPLWKREDDYSFGAEADAAPGRNLLRALREGPSVGVHTIAWIDSAANLRRTMEREALAEFGQRVLFQMSGQDSSLIIDSPEASRLGLWRAILMNLETGAMEKFRPYSMPSEDWLEHAADALRRRA